MNISQIPLWKIRRWLLTEILPIIWQRIPNLHLYIIGKGSDEVLTDINNAQVTVTGQVPSILPYLSHANVSVVPLRFESGMRFKILETGACGTPVVSTQLGAEGLPVTHGIHILLADDPSDFAEQVLRVIRDSSLKQELTSNLGHLIEKNYSIDSLAQQGKLIIKYLLHE